MYVINGIYFLVTLRTNKQTTVTLGKESFFIEINYSEIVMQVAAVAEFGSTERGRPTLLYRGFEYWKVRDNVSGTTMWRCVQHQRMKCKARVVTAGRHVVGDRQPDHTHSGNMSRSLARKAIADMKEDIEQSTATPSSSQAAVTRNLQAHVLMALPRRSVVTRTLQRRRQKLLSVDGSGNLLPPPPTDLAFAVPETFRTMVLFDSGPGVNRVILMGCDDLLDGLARADVWLADGTFKVVPSLFFQLYTIHFNFRDGINPAGLYCLLTNKTAETYAVVLQELKTLIPRAAPRKILVDFERASMNAFHDAFPLATVTGCYFHLTQSVLRKVNEVGLKTQYECDNELRGYIRCLPALAYVPPEDVVEAFNLLVETMPAADHVDEVTTYFKHCYIRGCRRRGRGEMYGPALFPIDTWNQYAAGADGIARTTNSVEGWHHGLQAMFHCHHPTLWTFMAGLKDDMTKQNTSFLQGAAGRIQPARKAYRDLQGRVERAVAGYGRAEILVYLRAMAYLSHT